MQVDPEEARASLEQVEQTAVSARRRLARQPIGWLLVIWGAVWLIGFLITQFLPAAVAAVAWLMLLTTGGIASSVVGVQMSRSVRYPRSGVRIGRFYAALFGFSLLWLWLLRPATWQQTALFVTTLLLFSVVVVGGLLGQRRMVWGGVAGTAVALAGYFLLPGAFALWLALLGGLPMLIAGLILVWQGRQ